MRCWGVLVLSMALGCSPRADSPRSSASASAPGGFTAVGPASPVLEAYRDRMMVACLEATSWGAWPRGDERSLWPSLEQDLSGTASASVEALALVAADRAVRIIAPRILEAIGRVDQAQQLADLPPVTTVAEAGRALEVLTSCTDVDAAQRAALAFTRRMWASELGSSTYPSVVPPEPTREDLLEYALLELSFALRLDSPTTCREPSTPEREEELDCSPPTREDLTWNIIATITALETAASAGLPIAEAERLVVETYTALIAASRR